MWPVSRPFALRGRPLRVGAAMRGTGLALLALCALASVWLCHAVQHVPPHAPTVREIAGAAGAVAGWSFGWVLLIEGPALLVPVTLPPRHTRFNATPPTRSLT